MKKSDITKKRILDEGVKLWPVINVSEIARRIGMTHAIINYYFKSRAKLERAVAHYAVENGKSRVIAQLIAVKHTAVRDMSAEDRAKHMAAIA